MSKVNTVTRKLQGIILKRSDVFCDRQKRIQCLKTVKILYANLSEKSHHDKPRAVFLLFARLNFL